MQSGQKHYLKKVTRISHLLKFLLIKLWEGSIRPLALGQKNLLFSDNSNGAESGAIFY